MKKISALGFDCNLCDFLKRIYFIFFLIIFCFSFSLGCSFAALIPPEEGGSFVSNSVVGSVHDMLPDSVPGLTFEVGAFAVSFREALSGARPSFRQDFLCCLRNDGDHNNVNVDLCWLYVRWVNEHKRHPFWRRLCCRRGGPEDFYDVMIIQRIPRVLNYFSCNNLVEDSLRMFSDILGISDFINSPDYFVNTFEKITFIIGDADRYSDYAKYQYFHEKLKNFSLCYEIVSRHKKLFLRNRLCRIIEDSTYKYFNSVNESIAVDLVETPGEFLECLILAIEGLSLHLKVFVEFGIGQRPLYLLARKIMQDMDSKYKRSFNSRHQLSYERVFTVGGIVNILKILRYVICLY